MSSSRTLVIILHFGSVSDTIECIDSLRRVVAPQFDIFVVNNGPDTTVEATLKSRYPDIVYRQAGVNTGFAAGNNIGLRFAMEHGYRYSLPINNDTVARLNKVREALLAARERGCDYVPSKRPFMSEHDQDACRYCMAAKALSLSASERGFCSRATGFSRPFATVATAERACPNASSETAIGIGSHRPMPIIAV